MKRYWYVGKPTGAWFEGGGQEIGNTCNHQHRSKEAAQKCAEQHEAPGFHEWSVYQETTT